MKLRNLLSFVLAVVMLFGCMSITAFAGETKQLTVNGGTDTSEYVPFYRGETNCPQQTEFIQPAETLTVMKGGKISKMTFYVSTGGESDASFTVKLLETEKSSFSGELVDTVHAYVVYSGTLNPADGVLEISFDTPYEYTGKNLLVAFTLEVPPVTTSSTTFYGTNVASNTGLTTYGLDFIQNVTFLPKVTFEYTHVTYLDLDTNTSKEIDQNYSFSQTDVTTYTDVTKVKLDWTISDIVASYNSNKTWDPIEMKWVEEKEVIAATNAGASFTLTNYSSKDVKATAAFAVETALESTFTEASFTNNNCTVKTPVTRDNNTYVDADFTALKQTIEASLTLNTAKFADLAATTSATKYGTYTITISAVTSGKLTQNISAPDIDSRGANTITLQPIAAGHGKTKYGYSTTDDSSTVTNWQDSVEFTDLNAGTTYYFFAKYEGDDEYEPAVSTGTSATACFAAGTKITMADGSLKNIEDISESDQVLTLNHETGAYEAQELFLVFHEEYQAAPFTLSFSNGNTLSIVGEHDLFEKESLKYVTINTANAEQYIGKHFYSVSNGKYVELTSVTFETEVVDFYSIYTKYNANCIANGMLSVPVETEDILNLYEINEDLTINQTQLEADITEYGLFEYPVDATYPEKYYDAFRMKYANIMVGKGLVTWDTLLTRINAGIDLEN